jgi:hypothetical protein
MSDALHYAKPNVRQSYRVRVHAGLADPQFQSPSSDASDTSDASEGMTLIAGAHTRAREEFIPFHPSEASEPDRGGVGRTFGTPLRVDRLWPHSEIFFRSNVFFNVVIGLARPYRACGGRASPGANVFAWAWRAPMTTRTAPSVKCGVAIAHLRRADDCPNGTTIFHLLFSRWLLMTEPVTTRQLALSLVQSAACQVCSAPFEVTRRRGRPQLFCSDPCRRVQQQQQMLDWSRKQGRVPRPARQLAKPPQPSPICAACGAPFELTRRCAAKSAALLSASDRSLK